TTCAGGLTSRGFIAPVGLAGAMNADTFAADIEQVLAPEARPGDRGVLDNLSSHKTAGVREAFARCRIGYRYLPPYSPDLNPIENAVSEVRGLVPAAAARAAGGLWGALGRLVDRCRPSQCRNSFRHCGYHATKT